MINQSSQNLIRVAIVQLAFIFATISSNVCGELIPIISATATVGTARAGARSVKNENKYPSYAVSSTNKYCAGTLIASDIILTAANCQGAFIGGVIIGGNRYNGSGGEYSAVAYEIPHPKFVKIIDKNDIMLVKLLIPSKAPLQKLNFDEGTTTKVNRIKKIGYGATKDGPIGSQQLMEVFIKVIEHSVCTVLWSRYDLNEKNNICAGDLKSGGVEGCDGDSGSPLLLVKKNEQVGLLSFSKGCTSANTPLVYTRLSGYKSFIQQNICVHTTSKRPSYCR